MQTTEFSELIKQLPTFQQRIVTELLSSEQSCLVAAENYFLASGPDNIQTFGGEPYTSKDSKKSKSGLWTSFLEEVNKFICGHADYSENRDKLFRESDVLKTIIITNVSTLLGSKFGMSAACVAPVIVLIVCTAIKLGKNAYCETYYDKKNEK